MDKDTKRKFMEIYNMLFPEGTIPFNSRIYMNDEEGLTQLIKDHDGYSLPEDFVAEMYNAEDDYVNLCYPEGVTSFSIDALIDALYEDTIGSDNLITTPYGPIF